MMPKRGKQNQPKPVPKPDKVIIKSHTTQAVVRQSTYEENGPSITLFIHGLGDDNRIYIWEGIKEQWYLQR